MHLSDGDICERLESDGGLDIKPLDNPDQQIQPASVDLRLGNEFLEFNRVNIPCIHPSKSDEVLEYTTETYVDDDEAFVLHPGDFVLGTTKEVVKIPADLDGEVTGRSSIGRLAVAVHATAGFIDPGYEGEITLEFSNVGVAPVALKPGMRIAQMILNVLTSPAERPYGEERGSKYQGQRGPQASKVGSDPDITE